MLRKEVYIGKVFLYNHFFLYGKIRSCSASLNSSVRLLRPFHAQIPVRDLPGVRIRAVKAQPGDAFDVQFELQSGQRRIVVLGEFKSAVPLKLLEGTSHPGFAA